MHIIGSSWELALFCVVAPDPVSIGKPVAFGHLLSHQCSSDTQEWSMEIHINKATRSSGTRFCRAGASRQYIPQCNRRTDAEPWMLAVSFTGQGDLQVAHLSFSGADAVSSVSLLQNWRSRSRRNTFRKNRGGCVLFSSVGFVINRKGCEAKIAESTPCREKNKTVDKTSANIPSQLSTNIARKNTRPQKWVGLSKK